MVYLRGNRVFVFEIAASDDSAGDLRQLLAGPIGVGIVRCREAAGKRDAGDAGIAREDAGQVAVNIAMTAAWKIAGDADASGGGADSQGWQGRDQIEDHPERVAALCADLRRAVPNQAQLPRPRPARDVLHGPGQAVVLIGFTHAPLSVRLFDLAAHQKVCQILPSFFSAYGCRDRIVAAQWRLIPPALDLVQSAIPRTGESGAKVWIRAHLRVAAATQRSMADTPSRKLKPRPGQRRWRSTI
ncbi:MAG: hypothetical protein KGO02_16095 [Alphaproteobacteria bacterium]|nr:hypothetical protein [Alphaproteobacteria bacterium]